MRLVVVSSVMARRASSWSTTRTLRVVRKSATEASSSFLISATLLLRRTLSLRTVLAGAGDASPATRPVKPSTKTTRPALLRASKSRPCDKLISVKFPHIFSRP